MEITRLLKAKKIAVIGASEREGSFGGDICRNIMDFSDQSKYYFVNPSRDEVFGKKCYRSIEEIPEDFDMAIIAIPKNLINNILKDASKKGCKGAVVYASGYSETGNQKDIMAEQDLIRACKELDIAMMGPNCAGFINYIDDVYSFAFIAEKRNRRGNIGLVSQSGQLCLSLMDNPKLKFSYVLSTGNSSLIRVEEYIEYLVEDVNTKVLAIYLEGVKKPEVFIRALKRAAEKRKPVVILKTGRSEKGSQISASHTGSLSGSDKTYDAIFKKFGVIRVDDMEELQSTAHLLSVLSEYPKGTGLAAMSVSGGESIITADTASLERIDFPNFNNDTIKKLENMLPTYATVNNPLDMTATLSYDSEKYAKALKAVIDDPNVDMVLIGYTLLLNVVDPCIYYMTEGIEKVVKEGSTKPILMMPFLENTRNPESMEKLEKLGVPILPPPLYAMKILKKLENFINYEYSEKTLELAIPDVIKNNKRFLSENQSKNMLKEAGIEVPKEEIVSSKDEAIKIAEKIGYPLVMKVESEDIPHKSDIGGVKLDIKTKEEVSDAYDEIMANVYKNTKNAKLNGILVQEMLPQGTEMIVGINNDPNFGPMVLCGLGGVFVEIFKDISLYPAPLNYSEAMDMICSLKGYPLLTDYRGGEKLDIDALANLLVRISDFAVENKDIISELDMNPVFLYKDGLAVADALIMVRE